MAWKNSVLTASRKLNLLTTERKNEVLKALAKKNQREHCHASDRKCQGFGSHGAI